MDADKVLEIVEQVLLSRMLSPLERLVFQQSWLGRGYNQMAQDSGYESNYIKEVGSELWHELSEALGSKVTKKNLQLVFNQYQPLRSTPPLSGNWSEKTAKPPAAGSAGLSARPPQRLPEFPSVALAASSPLYIDRPPVEELVCTEIHKPGCVIRIKAARKTGKSSLLNRMLAHAAALGYATVYLDFQEVDETAFNSLDRLLRWFSANTSRQLNLNPRLDEYWDEEMGSKVSCKIYFEEYLLQQLNRPLVLVLNEVNWLFEHVQVAQDFLPMLRSWHEQAQWLESWQKLRLVLAQSTEVYVPLRLNQSPFNIGLSIALPNFTPAQIQELAQRYGLDWSGAAGHQNALSLMGLLSGHPYLVNVALYHLSRGDVSPTELLKSTSTQVEIYRNHLRSYLALIQDQPTLAAALQRVMNAGEPVQLEALIAHKLESLGLIQLDGNWARPSCELYRLYFQEQLQSLEAIASPSKELETPPAAANSFDRPDKQTFVSDRRELHQYLDRHWQGWLEVGTSLTLLLCRIDYFKFYRDACGYRAAEAFIDIVTKVMAEFLGQRSELIAQSEEATFVAILTQMQPQATLATAERIRETVEALAIPLEQTKMGGFPEEVLTVSLGLVQAVPAVQRSPAVALAAAEQVLHQAKRQGGNCVVVGPELPPHSRHELANGFSDRLSN